MKRKFIFILLPLLFAGCSSLPEKSDENSRQSFFLAPKVLPQMQTADFWLKKIHDPEKVLMTAQQIDLWNQQVLDVTFPGDRDFYIVQDLRKADSLVTGDQIRQSLITYNPNRPWYKKIQTKDGQKIHTLNDKDFKIFWEEMNYEPLGSFYDYINQQWVAPPSNKEFFPVRKAVCIKRSDMRLVPEDEFYTDDKEFWYDDIAQGSGILMNEPVLVLWESKDKAWVLVQTSYCTAWVRSENIAFCTDSQFEKYYSFNSLNQKNFITVTQDKYRVIEEDFSVELYMGTYLHLADFSDSKVQENFLPRIPYSSWIVEIPSRDKDGNLKIEYASIPVAFAVQGFVPFTQKNLLTLAFQSLGLRYGWGGMQEARDCSEYTKEIFRCFGFSFPRNSVSQSAMPGKTVNFAEKTSAEKQALYDSLPAGSILCIPGHVLIYLGKDGSDYYAISALGSYYPDGKFITQKTDACSVTINSLEAVRKNRKTWFDSITSAKLFFIEKSDGQPQKTLNRKWEFSSYSEINSGAAFLYRAKENRKNLTVAVNAGHGTKGGSGKKTYSHPDKSPKLTGGTTAQGEIFSISVSDGMTFKDDVKTPEKEVNLRLARMIKRGLLKAGFDVLMIREEADVQLDNVARTVIANNNADIHIAIHFDGDNLSYDKGVFYCGIPEKLKNLKNVKKTAAESERLGKAIVAQAQKKGISVYNQGRMEVDLTQTSYTLIPSVDFEFGNQCTDLSYRSLEERAQFCIDGIKDFFQCVD